VGERVELSMSGFEIYYRKNRHWIEFSAGKDYFIPISIESDRESSGVRNLPRLWSRFTTKPISLSSPLSLLSCVSLSTILPEVAFYCPRYLLFFFFFSSLCEVLQKSLSAPR
jgi:hypothetical protein